MARIGMSLCFMCAWLTNGMLPAAVALDLQEP
jgi:hypothetical protein